MSAILSTDNPTNTSTTDTERTYSCTVNIDSKTQGKPKFSWGKLRILVSNCHSTHHKHRQAFQQLIDPYFQEKKTNKIDNNIPPNELEIMGYNSKLIDFKYYPLSERDTWGLRGNTLTLWSYNTKSMNGIILLCDATDGYQFGRKRILYDDGQIEWEKREYGHSSIIRDLKVQIASIEEKSSEFKAPVLIFITNQYNETTTRTFLTNQQIAESLDLPLLSKQLNRSFHIQSLNIVSGEGLIDGLDWLSSQLFLPRIQQITNNKDNQQQQMEGEINNNQVEGQPNNNNTFNPKPITTLLKCFVRYAL